MVEKPKAHPPTEEATWVAQALAGDSRGFEALMRRYHAPLRRLLRAILRDEEDAQDLLQETFLRAYRFLHRFDPSRPFGPWLLRIGTNLARNQLRHRASRREVPLNVKQADDREATFEGRWLADGTTLERVEYSLLLEQTRSAMAALPEEQRVVLEMRLLGEMSYREIAAALGIPIGTVMSRLNRGRHQLQVALGEGAGAPAVAPEVS